MQALEAVAAMGSLLEELARREAAVRQRIEEIREQIAGLESRLETEEDLLSRLVITRQMVEEILGETAHLVEEPVGETETREAPAGPGDAAGTQAVPRGVVTVPPWLPAHLARHLIGHREQPRPVLTHPAALDQPLELGPQPLPFGRL
ncbi:hypothetical protein, partial [Actinomadura rubrisoli]|uniref:hypothetical protein n=1 Tax=Actinomadura rubrisoli TaxID=2530368 RepID=UPI001AA00635